MSEKAKLDKPSVSRINRYVFLILWVLAQALGWGFFFALMIFQLLPNSNEYLMGFGFALIVGIPTAFFQKLVLRVYFGRNFKTWLRWSSFGSLIGGAAFGLFLAAANYIPYRIGNLVFVLSFMLPVSFAQAWVLRRYVNHAWLWALATIAGASLFSLVLQQIDDSPEMGFVAFGAYALATGLTMLWLFGMSRTVEKRKTVEAIQHERLEDNLASEIVMQETLINNSPRHEGEGTNR